MSTILKALKKLEEEQRAGAPLPLDSRIVSERGRAAGARRSGLPMVLGVIGGGLAVSLAVAGWFWLKPPADIPVALVPVAVISGEAPPPARPRPEPTAAPAPAPLDSPAPVVPSRPESSPAAPQAQPVAPPATVSAAPLQGSSPFADATPLQVTVADRQIPEAGRQWVAPHLSVTEIFPPAAGGEWMAVVNDLPIMAGTTVEGALVERIERDRVLFSLDGRQIAVPLARR